MKRATAAGLLAGLAFASGLSLFVVGHRERAAELGTAVRGPSPQFTLRDVAGNTLTANGFRGRWALYVFGYTHCPDFCPTALLAAGSALKGLGPAADRMRVVFLTVDPERDTPDILAEYLGNFDPRIVGLWGSVAETAAAAKSFKVYFEKRLSGDGGDYSIDHTAVFSLIDPAGRTAAVYPYNIPPDALADNLRNMMSGQN